MKEITPADFNQQYVDNGKILSNDLKIDGGYLYLSHNNITIIENIPDGVTHLYLRNNNITIIENIPDSVIELDLYGNNISTIDDIPDGVERLYLYNNPIYKYKKHNEFHIDFVRRIIEKQKKIKKIKAL